jgi:hypothetical protein
MLFEALAPILAVLGVQFVSLQCERQDDLPAGVFDAAPT